MAIYIRRGLNSPTNDCIKQTTQPEELAVGTDCERAKVGLDPAELPSGGGGAGGGGDGYGDGYSHFSNEGPNPTTDEPAGEHCAPGSEFRGYHKFTLTEYLSGTSVTGECVSPYSRAAFGKGGLQGAIIGREEQLIRATGKPVQLLRRQYTGARCPCYSLNRARSKKSCAVCFGTSFVPGYIPFIDERDPLGRIFVRFDPHEERLTLKGEGMFQEVEINAWTLPYPQIRQRDVIIVYNLDGTEEFRYEVTSVTRNETFQGASGAQKFLIKRMNPNDHIYDLDPFALPDLADISIDVSSEDPLLGDRFYDRLGAQDDGVYANVFQETPYGDAAFSGMFTEGYKLGYEVNFRRALNFQQPMHAPDFNENGFVDDGYGPIFLASNGKMIRFSTPQVVENNPGINPIEVITAEQKKYFLEGFINGAKHGQLDGVNELRARGLIT